MPLRISLQQPNEYVQILPNQPYLAMFSKKILQSRIPMNKPLPPCRPSQNSDKDHLVFENHVVDKKDVNVGNTCDAIG